MAHGVNDRDLTRRTHGEELWCRRRAAGLTSREAAEALGIGRTTLYLEERKEGPRRLPLLARHWASPRLPELLALARRRSGWGMHGTAQRARVCHVTLLRMERSGSPDLRAFWEERGFTFVR